MQRLLLKESIVTLVLKTVFIISVFLASSIQSKTLIQTCLDYTVI